MIPTTFPQIGISKKSRFHLLKSVDLPINAQISAGSFTESELDQMAARSGNMIVRTAIALQDIDMYREHEDFNKQIIFLLGIYLQEKTASFINMNVNITGQLWTSQDPYNLKMRNITIYTYGAVYMFFSRVS